MATNLTPGQLRDLLGSREGVREDPFSILKSISGILNSGTNESVGRELLLRALEWREDFGGASEVLDSLARIGGLYPYVDIGALGVKDRIAYEYHRPIDMREDIVFHREQAEVYRRLLAGESVILSAPTSFGKSKIIDAMIATGRFSNIAVIVPTLALIDETRRRLAGFSPTYKLVTHLSQQPGEKNIFVFTAERAVAYEELPKIQFFVIDEFYKIGALEEDESRTVALNEAFYRLSKGGGQFYLLGPNIQRIPAGLERAFRCHFFATQFSTVVVETSFAPGQGKDISRLLSLLNQLDEPTLVYCSSPGRVNDVARALVESQPVREDASLRSAREWVSNTYHPDWVFAAGLSHGVGIHHGRLPRSLAQYVVRAFNDDRIRYLICTSTLIEGVNTKAKNVVIWDNEIGGRSLDFFTFNNIKGRSGRMFHHFVGRVFLFDTPPQESLPFVDFPLFTQDAATPETLLLQLDRDDLSEESRARVSRFADQNVLSLETLRANRSVDPEAQLRLASHIDDNALRFWPSLSWRGFPEKYDQLKFVCELLWEYFVDSKRRQGVFSGSQLTMKTWQLYQTASTAKRVLSELKPGKYAAKSPDEAVERVLQFERNWAGFELPRLLVAISRIQAEVLTRRGLPAGDYTAFAGQAESLFRPPVINALDEYGIPITVGEKLQAYLRTKDDLDVALTNLKRLNLDPIRLAPFERELATDAQRAL